MSDTPEEASVEPLPLSRELREAFSEAAQDDRIWNDAKADPGAFLRERGVGEDGFSIAFLDAERKGDSIRYTGAGGQLVLEMNCPPQRMWWHFCRRLMRVCEQRTIIVDGKPETVDINCFIVCEAWVWEEELTLPKRPPFPPWPLHEPISAAE